jgi:hypothetical protein
VLAAAVVAAFGTAGAVTAGAADGRRGSDNLSAIGLTSDDRLIRFKVNRPGRPSTIGTISGLSGDTRLVGIDYRVQDGKLYGVGNAGGVYTLSTDNGRARRVSQLTVALSGTSFAVDFNPAADRLRILSDRGQNLRHNVNPDGSTLTDTALAYPPAADTTTGVVAAAYTNNDLDPNTGTTLFDLDTKLGQMALQSPANSGQLAVVGKLGAGAGPDAGFDIYAPIRSGRAVDGVGYAVLTDGPRTSLYAISLITGASDRVGTFPGGLSVADLALPLDQN